MSLALKRGTLILFMAIGSHACAATSFESRLEKLETEEQERRSRIAELDAEIAAAEARAEHAKQQARYRECRATAAAIEADIAVRGAECLKTAAEYDACKANNSATTSGGTALGCGAGLLFAVLTGGAAAPAVVIGCGGGAAVGAANRKSCGSRPACVDRIPQLPQAVLRERGLRSAPICRPPASTPPVAAAAKPKATPKPKPKQCGDDRRLSWVQFSVPKRNEAGDAWDRNGSPPELVYTILIDGKRVYESAPYETFVWRHEPQRSLSVSTGQEVAVYLIDKDFRAADRVGIFKGRVPAPSANDELQFHANGTTARIGFACD